MTVARMQGTDIRAYNVASSIAFWERWAENCWIELSLAFLFEFRDSQHAGRDEIGSNYYQRDQ